MDGIVRTEPTAAGLGEMAEFTVYIRLGADGEVLTLTGAEIEGGNAFSDTWAGSDTYREFSISVSARMPVETGEAPPVTHVVVPDDAGVFAATAVT